MIDQPGTKHTSRTSNGNDTVEGNTNGQLEIQPQRKSESAPAEAATESYKPLNHNTAGTAAYHYQADTCLRLADQHHPTRHIRVDDPWQP